ncbi:hypothetical protein SAMN02745673_02195 [Marinactinospora thermotolerans DSM 45154]|uniref:Uncharacterized protein n=1 Tax=Marinactinospora thermotolerans DSM 45154 TaxID=1122192 RepID=A0A1T4QFH9_9ACTN|nr:hypothetical protein [Marinactinospora thermotolerans]SKA02251.1 hypothetical protein SAMN02745673_02195 [Marinactinospora thermotolerans DSM 45154]
MPISRFLAAGLVLAAAGCAAAPEDPQEGGPPEVGLQVRALHVPLDDYNLSRPDIETIEYAEDLLIGACMRDLGLDWELLPPPEEHDADPLNRRRYGLVEPEVARRYGYHPPPPAPGQRAREEARRVRAALPLGEQVAAYGTDGRGGCLAEARERLGADVPGFDAGVLNGYIGDTFEASRRDPRVVEVVGAWSACMRERGYAYEDPLDVLSDPAWAETEEASSREVAVAGADVLCKAETDLVAVWNAVEDEIQREVIDANPGDFALFGRVRDAELDAAREVIEATDPP